MVFALLFAASLLLGRYPRPGFASPMQILSDPVLFRVFRYLRLPRTITASLLGAALAAAGCTFQMLFKNPLVEPGFLGVTQGAAFGAALAILLVPALPGGTQLFAVAFAIIGLSLSYGVARRLQFGGWVIRMVISGLSVSAFFAAGIGILKYIADPITQLQEITFWMLGGLQGATWSKTLTMLPVTVPAMIVIFLYRWRLNVLSLDDVTAFSTGTNPARERLLLLLAASMATAGVTAVAGIIGWVGLLVPHVARSVYGAEGSRVVPASLFIGGIMVLVCDGIARSVMVYEIPLGILTSLLGAALFILLLVSGGVRFRR